MPSLSDTPTARPLASGLDLTLVIDIGKTRAKLLLIDAQGAVVEHHSRANASVTSALGYPALDVQGLQDWMQATLRASANARRCGHVIASTHGAALVALDGQGAAAPLHEAVAQGETVASHAALAWAPLDYEFEAVALEGAAHTAFAAANHFRETLSPELPAGLNAARQLHWLQATHPQAWRSTRTLMPYAQYWAWLLCGVASSEVSSLGCHTHLWSPQAGNYSSLAVARGWAALFAPLRRAWEVLGAVGAGRAAAWGLPADCQVHVGVHDSNACLARYLAGERGAHPQPAHDGPVARLPAMAAAAAQAAVPEPLTIVSSGTWTVLMAPGAPSQALRAEQDMLGNVDVTGRMTPTARFMGGREFAALLDGASPEAATPQSVQAILDTATLAVPAFSQHGGPFAGRMGYVQRLGQRLEGDLSQHLEEAQRAALAALYCAQVTAWLTMQLWQHSEQASGRVIVEGPLASNPVYLQLLQALLPHTTCYASSDAVEGTARGAWMLARWSEGTPPMALQRMASPALPGLVAYQQQWLAQVHAQTPHG